MIPIKSQNFLIVETIYNICILWNFSIYMTFDIYNFTIFIIIDQFTQFWVIGPRLPKTETCFWKSAFELFIKFQTFLCTFCIIIKIDHIKMLFNFPSECRINIFKFFACVFTVPFNRNWDKVTTKITLLNLYLIILCSFKFRYHKNLK